MQKQLFYGQINTICVIGHGSIGKGTLPLIKKHFKFDKMTIIDPHPVQEPEVSQTVQFLKIGLTRQNFRSILDQIFVPGKIGFCVNLSVGTSSSQIIQYCQTKKVFYIDTVKEQWQGYYSNENINLSERTNYALRQALLRDVRKPNLKTTAISCCGANPGMVSWFVKQALINLAKDIGFQFQEPTSKEQWALLMKNLGVKGIHIAERDTQRSNQIRNHGQFWNTWSVDGFISQGYHQPAQLGWGTHEKDIPNNAVFHRQGCQSSIYLTKPGMNVTVKTWCPTLGPQFGFLVTHDQAISISDYYTVKQNNKVVYRPTCHYAYHPCNQAVMSAMESIGSGSCPEENQWKILEKQIVTGMDELGVLLYGHSKNAYWYGSQLDIQSARKRAPKQNATALQVTSAIIAGMVWALQNPEAGLVEPDEMDYKRCLQIQDEYISPVRGYYTDWNPLKNKRNYLVQEQFCEEDAWQFKNVLMHK